MGQIAPSPRLGQVYAVEVVCAQESERNGSGVFSGDQTFLQTFRGMISPFFALHYRRGRQVNR